MTSSDQALYALMIPGAVIAVLAILNHFQIKAIERKHRDLD